MSKVKKSSLPVAEPRPTENLPPVDKVDTKLNAAFWLGFMVWNYGIEFDGLITEFSSGISSNLFAAILQASDRVNAGSNDLTAEGGVHRHVLLSQLRDLTDHTFAEENPYANWYRVGAALGAVMRISRDSAQVAVKSCRMLRASGIASSRCPPMIENGFPLLNTWSRRRHNN